MTDKEPPRRSRKKAGLIAILVLASHALVGCDVINPGPVVDEFLDAKEAHQALVNGAASRVSTAVGSVAVTTAMTAREVFPTGETSVCCDVLVQAGVLSPNGDLDGGPDRPLIWISAHQARWIAEDAARRFEALGPEVSASVLSEAYLYGGYANRLMGENFCQAVFDGGPAEPSVRHFERARDQFTKAIAKGGSAVVTAAYAGRASVHLWMGNVDAALADAEKVPFDFVFQVRADPSDWVTRNAVYNANANAPWRAYTGWKTWFGDYYLETGDPRVAHGTDARFPFGNASLQGYGPVPWTFQLKYPGYASPFDLSTGREMALVKAEALLVKAQWQPAMELINRLRATVISNTTRQPLAPWTANSLAQAWTFLKRERGIELWLEGRRMGDIRRWEDGGTLGVVDWPSFESVTPLFSQHQRDDCIPIPDIERDTNTNL